MITQHQDEIEAQRAENEMLKTEIADHKAELDKQADELGKYLSEHTIELDRLGREKADLEKEHANHLEELKASHKPIDEHEKELEEAYQKHHEALQDKIGEHEKEKAGLDAHRDKINAEHENLKEEHKAAQRSLQIRMN